MSVSVAGRIPDLLLDRMSQKRHHIFADADPFLHLLENLILLATIRTLEPLRSHQGDEDLRPAHRVADAFVPALAGPEIRLVAPDGEPRVGDLAGDPFFEPGCQRIDEIRIDLRIEMRV